MRQCLSEEPDTVRQCLSEEPDTVRQCLRLHVTVVLSCCVWQRSGKVDSHGTPGS